eukprot:TRINITY_DN12786_c0_g1_i2.p1 TRINITY_DN12786_c0_g1~~TRINITY_DN12786_c0_g1_i2.p1  ORF type:complete len:643 (+),score=199.04 TRINITY_DN12786_c0_g1_i2:80-2008(+)
MLRFLVVALFTSLQLSGAVRLDDDLDGLPPKSPGLAAVSSLSSEPTDVDAEAWSDGKMSSNQSDASLLEKDEAGDATSWDWLHKTIKKVRHHIHHHIKPAIKKHWHRATTAVKNLFSPAVKKATKAVKKAVNYLKKLSSKIVIVAEDITEIAQETMDGFVERVLEASKAALDAGGGLRGALIAAFTTGQDALTEAVNESKAAIDSESEAIRILLERLNSAGADIKQAVLESIVLANEQAPNILKDKLEEFTDEIAKDLGFEGGMADVKNKDELVERLKKALGQALDKAVDEHNLEVHMAALEAARASRAAGGSLRDMAMAAATAGRDAAKEMGMEWDDVVRVSEEAAKKVFEAIDATPQELEKAVKDAKEILKGQEPQLHGKADGADALVEKINALIDEKTKDLALKNKIALHTRALGAAKAAAAAAAAAQLPLEAQVPLLVAEIDSVAMNWIKMSGMTAPFGILKTRAEAIKAVLELMHLPPEVVTGALQAAAHKEGAEQHLPLLMQYARAEHAELEAAKERLAGATKQEMLMEIAGLEAALASRLAGGDKKKMSEAISLVAADYAKIKGLSKAEKESAKGELTKMVMGLLAENTQELEEHVKHAQNKASEEGDDEDEDEQPAKKPEEDGDDADTDAESES